MFCADLDGAMRNVATWVSSLLPILTAKEGGNAPDRMDQTEQLSTLLANVGNLVSGIGSSLAQAAQNSSHPADIDISYEIDVDVCSLSVSLPVRLFVFKDCQLSCTCLF